MAQKINSLCYGDELIFYLAGVSYQGKYLDDTNDDGYCTCGFSIVVLLLCRFIFFLLFVCFFVFHRQILRKETIIFNILCALKIYLFGAFLKNKKESFITTLFHGVSGNSYIK